MSTLGSTLHEDPGEVGATIAQLSESLVVYGPRRKKGKVTVGSVERSKSPCSPLGQHEGERTKEVLDATEVLNFLFPPLVTEEDGVLYVQEISHTPATGLEVIALQEQLELRSQLRSARPHGVCPQREELGQQCFDEIIRQVAIECPERGLLLSRIRDELNTTINGYKALIDTAACFGMRKVLQRNIQLDIEKELDQLEYEVQIQQKRVHSLAAKLGKTKKIIEDRQKLLEVQHEEELRFIKKGNIQLNNELKRLTQN